jgi:hypothetical protein
VKIAASEIEISALASQVEDLEISRAALEAENKEHVDASVRAHDEWTRKYNSAEEALQIGRSQIKEAHGQLDAVKAEGQKLMAKCQADYKADSMKQIQVCPKPPSGTLVPALAPADPALAVVEHPRVGIGLARVRVRVVRGRIGQGQS